MRSPGGADSEEARSIKDLDALSNTAMNRIQANSSPFDLAFPRLSGHSVMADSNSGRIESGRFVECRVNYPRP